MTARRLASQRSTRTPRAVAPRAVQLALFPEAVDVRPLDTRTVAGAHTRVRGVWQVRYASEGGREPATHRVFLDRHGWYCEAHGPGCRATAAARAAAEQPDRGGPH